MKKEKSDSKESPFPYYHYKYTTLQGKAQVIRELFTGKNPLYDEKEL